MKVYRIESRSKTYDCWGRTEWDFWRPYGSKVYSTKEKAQEAIRNIGTNHWNTEYRITEIDLE